MLGFKLALIMSNQDAGRETEKEKPSTGGQDPVRDRLRQRIILPTLALILNQ